MFAVRRFLLIFWCFFNVQQQVGCNLDWPDFVYNTDNTLENDDSDSPIEEVLEIWKTSAAAGLTAEAARCDDLIYKNLKQNANSKDSQPTLPTIVDVKLVVLSLNGIADVNGVVSLTAEVLLRWFDPRLAVDDSSCRTETLSVPTTEIWFPYFLVENGAQHIFYPDAFRNYPSLVAGNGYVQWRIAFPFKLNCDTDDTLFPWDREWCSFQLVSIHYDKGDLVYIARNTSRAALLFNQAANHPLWAITGQAFESLTNPPGLRIWLEYQRKEAYYMYTIVIPMFAVFLQTAATFIMPENADEKMSTAVASLMSYFFLFLLFTSTAPQSSASSLLIFYGSQIIFAIAIVLVASIITRLVHLEKVEAATTTNKSKPSVASSSVDIARLSTLKRIVYVAAAMLKNRRIRASQLNVGYVLAFAVSLLGYIGFTVAGFRSASTDKPVAITPIYEYQIGE